MNNISKRINSLLFACMFVILLIPTLLKTNWLKIIFIIFLKGQVVTECPAGTKCVQDFFCNENAVMVSYRVSLTPEQKKRRGDLIVIWLINFLLE